MQKKKLKSPIAGNKILIIFVAVFVAAAVIFGVVFGTIAAIRRARAVAEFSGVTMDEKTASYFASYYKYKYIATLVNSGVDAYDSSEFWGSGDSDGVSYGSRLILGVRNFISDILVGNYYFDRYGKLDEDDKDQIEKLYNEVISRYTSDKLDEALSAASTDTRSLKRAIEMYYKALCAKTEIYGTNGATLMGYPDECDKYLNESSRVKLLFIRSDNTFVVDDEGNRRIENGEYLMRDLTDKERAERAELIARIDSEIEGYKNGGDIQITEGIFETYIRNYGEGEDDKTKSGYYFSESSDYSIAFSEDVSADVVKAALDMEIGEYRKVEGKFGSLEDYGDYTFNATCYIYKCPVESGAYVDTAEDGFFYDFYSDAADFLYSNMLEDMREDTVFYGKLTEEEIIGISYHPYLYVF